MMRKSITHLQKNLPVETTPERRHKKSQNRIDFKASHEHRNSNDAFTEHGQVGIRASSTDDTKCWATASHSRNAQAKRIQKGHAIPDKQGRPGQVKKQIKCKKTHDPCYDIFPVDFSIGADGHDAVRQYLCFTTR